MAKCNIGAAVGNGVQVALACSCPFFFFRSLVAVARVRQECHGIVWSHLEVVVVTWIQNQYSQHLDNLLLSKTKINSKAENTKADREQLWRCY